MPSKFAEVDHAEKENPASETLSYVESAFETRATGQHC
jgi:hypothetical protein